MRTSLKVFCGLALLVMAAGCNARFDGNEEARRVPESPGESVTTATPPEGCQAGTYKIAYQGPLTGQFASLGEDMINGIRFAVDRANELELAGENVRVEVEPLDSQGSGDQAPPLASQAAQDEEVVALIGPTLWHETEVSGPIFEDAGLPFITPSATAPPQSEEEWRFFFRLVGSDTAQGHAAAEFLAEHLDASKVAVVDDSSSNYGEPIANAVANALGRYGVAVVHRASVPPGRDDYSGEVADVLSSGAEAVFFGGYYPEAGIFKRDLAAMGGGSIPFVSDDGTYASEYLETVGLESAEPTYVTFRGLAPSSAGPQFTQAYREQFDREPGAFSLESHDAASLIIDGLRWGACDRASMRDFIANYQGEIRGRAISFDENGDIKNPGFTVYRVVDDGWVVELQHLTSSPTGASFAPTASPRSTP